MSTTEQHVKKELRSWMGKDPNEVIWDQLKSDGLVQAAIDDDYSIEDLAADYRRFEEFAAKLSPGARASGQGGPRTYDRSAGADLQPVAELLAIEAAREPLVLSFRDRVLHGRLLDTAEARAWHAGRSSLVERWHMRAPETLPPLGPRQTVDDSLAAVNEYIAGNFLSPAQERDFLDCLSDVLIEWYGWPQFEDVRAFVLAGKTPRIYRFQASLRPRRILMRRTSTIVMHVNVAVGPRELMDLYSESKKALGSGIVAQRFRPTEDATNELALFVASRNDGRSWKTLHGEWLSGHPDSQEDLESFRRKARIAYERLASEKLIYHGNGKHKKGETDADQD